jgi:hypothetical protein
MGIMQKATESAMLPRRHEKYDPDIIMRPTNFLMDKNLMRHCYRILCQLNIAVKFKSLWPLDRLQAKALWIQ